MRLFTVFLFVLLAGTTTPTEPTIPPCPVTLPTLTPFVPPQPYPEKPGWAGRFWFGTKRLWTILPSDGTWNLSREEELRQKLFWFREGYQCAANPQPGLKVSARRLDGAAPSIPSCEVTCGTHDDLKSFMLAGINFPTAGCWEIAGKVRGQELRFVVRIATSPDSPQTSQSHVEHLPRLPSDSSPAYIRSQARRSTPAK